MKTKVMDSPTYQQEAVTSKTIKSVLLKQSIFAVCIVGISILVNLCLRLDYVFNGPLITENSITEWAQQLMLGIAVLAFYRIAKQNPSLKHAAILISGFFAVMFIRELDFLFDYIVHGFWELPAALITIGAVAYAWRGGKSVMAQMARLLEQTDMRLLIAGVMMLLVFTRLFGMGSFWQGVMHDHYIRDVKNIAEEGTELLCYCLIAYASVSTQLGLRRTTSDDSLL